MARRRGSAKGAAAKRKRKSATPRRPRCEARTKAGKRCTNPAKEGATVCGTHGGKAGAPSKFNPATCAKILQATRQANFRSVICRAANVHPTTLENWLERGELAVEQGKTDDEYGEFFEEYERAEAEAEMLLVARLQRASQEGDVRANLELLRRRYRERWGDRVQAEHSGPGGGPIETQSSIDVDKLPLDKRRQLLALLDEAKATHQGGSA